MQGDEIAHCWRFMPKNEFGEHLTIRKLVSTPESPNPRGKCWIFTGAK